MSGRFSGWRGWGGAVLALLLVVLAATPALDAILCQADAPREIALTSSHGAVDAATPDQAPHGGEVGDVCPHGHCHHFSAALAEADPRPGLPAFLTQPPNDRAQRALVSLPGGAPERPPRV